MTARSAQDIKAEIKRNSSVLPAVSKGAVGAAIGDLNKYLGGDDNRHLVFWWLFGRVSGKQLTDGQRASLHKWVDPWRDDNMEWHTGVDFPEEARLCLIEAMRAYSKMTVADKLKLESAGITVPIMVNFVVSKLGGEITSITDDSKEDVW